MNVCLDIGLSDNQTNSSVDRTAQISQNQSVEQQKEKMPEGIYASNRGKSNTKKYHYNWNKTENKKYLNFLIKNRQLFNLNQEERKCVKINVIMSEMIKSRSAAQCHSHHQKMMIKYSSIENIIKANYDLISMKMVPKKCRELLEDLTAYKRSKQNVGRENEVVQESRHQNTTPVWYEYINDNSYHMSSPFNDEASYFL